MSGVDYIDQLKRDRDALVSELRAAGSVKFKGNSCSCFNHRDKHNSGGIKQNEKGHWKFKCFTASCGWSGTVLDVMAYNQGRDVKDVIKDIHERNKPMPEVGTQKTFTIEQIEGFRKQGNHEATYKYTNPLTKHIDLLVVRFRNKSTGKKTFIQATPFGVDGKFVLQAPSDCKPIYNRTRVMKSRSVFVVEGEKCVHELASYGFTATTSPGGADGALKADWGLLAGKKIYFWPDNDESGKIYIEHVYTELKSLEPRPEFFWIDINDLGLNEKDDVVDFIEMQDDKDPKSIRILLTALVQDAKPEIGAFEELEKVIEDTIDGKRMALPTPWPGLINMTKALLPGSVTILGGDPGASKSFMLLQMMWFWHKQGIKSALYCLEDDRELHTNRILAQVSGCSGILNDEWIRRNPEEARKILSDHKEFISKIGRKIYTSPDKQVTLDELVEWVNARANDGCEVIAIDPITLAATTDKVWIKDLDFIVKVKYIIRKAGARLILVTHPKLGQHSGLSKLAGGAAYPRFSHTVLWLDNLGDLKLYNIKASGMVIEMEINRTLKISKARFGSGQGAKLGLIFRKDTLCFGEQGVVQDAVKKKKDES